MSAQTFTNLHNFNGSDEANPYAGLILSGDTLYGTADFGGSSGKGTVFAVNTNGAGYTNLYGFTATSALPPNTNSDGANPRAALILSGTTLYGTAYYGGSSGNGTVFKVNTNGSSFTTLHSFTATPDSTNSDGANPYAGLVLSDNTLYGTTFQGGTSGGGTVFRVQTDGSGFTNLHNFTGSDGTNLYAGLILSGSTLYGAAYSGGSSNFGTLFKLETDGTGFTILFEFNSGDGANPYGSLILSGDVLYGTTVNGGSFGRGTVFRIKTDVTVFTNLYVFTGSSDGSSPYSSLALSGNILYGTTYSGGIPNQGTVFKLETDGSDFTNFYSFTGGSDGANPQAGVILSGDTLYGTAFMGGSVGAGTVFGFSLGSIIVLPPLLTITPSGAEVILTWPASASGFTLQSTTNLVPLSVWNTVSPPPIVVSGQNTVTNPISGTQMFYRLSQ